MNTLTVKEAGTRDFHPRFIIIALHISLSFRCLKDNLEKILVHLSNYTPAKETLDKRDVYGYVMI